MGCLWPNGPLSILQSYPPIAGNESITGRSHLRNHGRRHNRALETHGAREEHFIFDKTKLHQKLNSEFWLESPFPYVQCNGV